MIYKMLKRLDDKASGVLQKHFSEQEIHSWFHRPRSSLRKKSPYEIMLNPTQREIDQINQIAYLIDAMLRGDE